MKSNYQIVTAHITKNLENLWFLKRKPIFSRRWKKFFIIRVLKLFFHYCRAAGTHNTAILCDYVWWCIINCSLPYTKPWRKYYINKILSKSFKASFIYISLYEKSTHSIENICIFYHIETFNFGRSYHPSSIHKKVSWSIFGGRTSSQSKQED